MRLVTAPRFALCFESDATVRTLLFRACRGLFTLRFEDRDGPEWAERVWQDSIPPVDVVLLQLPDTDVAALSRLARLRAANPDLPIVVTTTYDGAYQLVADRLARLVDRVVFRPFDAVALATTMRGVCQLASGKNTGVC